MMDLVLLCINFIFLNMSLYRQEIDKVVREKYDVSNILEYRWNSFQYFFYSA